MYCNYRANRIYFKQFNSVKNGSIYLCYYRVKADLR